MSAQRAQFTPWDVRELPALLPAEEAAQRGAALGWIDTSIAEILERFGGETDSDAAKTIFAKHAANFRWHAKLWNEEILSSGTTAEPGVAKTIVDEVAASKATDLVDALTAVYRVLIPRLVAAKTYHQRALNVNADAATHRWVPFMIDDALEAMRDGELLLQSLLTSADAVQKSADTRARLETSIVQAGGLIGPTTLGDFSEAVKEIPIR